MIIKSSEQMQSIEKARAALEARKTRSAWDRGVSLYISDLLDNWECNAPYELDDVNLVSLLLNGARDWDQYSWGGSSLCYNHQIAERLCSPSELKRTRNGQRRPNHWEEWLDVQTRALEQACLFICNALRA